MEWVETTGRTVEEAKKAALEQLGVEEADADVEVIAEPKVGLFGRLREEARVRARVQPRYPRSKVDRRDRKRRGASHEHQPATEAEPKSGTAESAQVSRERARPKPRSVAEKAPATRRRRKSSEAGQGADDAPEPEGTNFGTVSAEGLQQQADLAETFLKGLVAEMGASATVSSHTVAEGIVEVTIEGEGLGTLIGPKGSTLLALQELTRTVLQRQTTSEGRILIDINGYRRRRQEALGRFAQQVAAEVRSSGVKRALEPMPPADRKVVHDAVNDIEGVHTVSEGEEPYRRVVLVPERETGDDQSGSIAQPAAS